MVANGINLSKVALGTIPLGTGKDFSKACGWGTDPPYLFL